MVEKLTKLVWKHLWSWYTLCSQRLGQSDKVSNMYFTEGEEDMAMILTNVGPSKGLSGVYC